MDRIGPTFAKELQDAGLAGLRFSWGADGTFQFDPSVTKAQRTAILAVFAAHNPDALETDEVRDAYVEAKAAITTIAGNAAIPSDARQAVVKLGLCVEALLKLLQRRIT